MKTWMLPTLIGLIQIGAGWQFIKAGNMKLGLFYFTCAASNAVMAFVP